MQQDSEHIVREEKLLTSQLRTLSVKLFDFWRSLHLETGGIIPEN